MATSIAINHGPCRIGHCSNLRDRLSPYCRLHAKRYRRTGHPMGRAIRPVEYAHQLTRVRELFRDNQDHAGLQAAQRLIRSILERAAAGDSSVAGAAELARLHAAAINPQEILAAVIAVAVYAEGSPHRLPDDARLTYAMAQAAMHLAPRPTKTTSNGKRSTVPPRPGDVKALGDYLRHVLAPFVVNVRHALESRVEQQQSLIEQLREPLRPPVVALMEAQASASSDK